MSDPVSLSTGELVHFERMYLSAVTCAYEVRIKVRYFSIPTPPRGHVLDALVEAGWHRARGGSLVRGYFLDFDQVQANIDVLEVTPES